MPKMTAMALAWMLEKDWARWCEIDPTIHPDYPRYVERMQGAYRTYTAAGTRASD